MRSKAGHDAGRRATAHAVRRRRLPAGVPLVSVGLLAALAAPAPAQVHADEVPAELRGVGVTQKLDAQLPLDTPFFSEHGRPVKLGDYFRAGRPVAITLNYFRCASLCNYQLNGLVDALKQMPGFAPGEKFEIVTVSFDPLENAQLAKLKKDAYIAELGQPGVERGWHFLTGSKESIRALTGAVGFGYRWNQEEELWAHDAVLVVCKPDGRISRYLGGLHYEPDVLRLSLVEASAGKVGSFWDAVFLTCFHYDAKAGRYTPAVMNIMRLGGVATLLLLGGVVGGYWVRERRRSPASAALSGS
ncbi:MAG: SCO family protein [Phycisphaerae bacterium]